MTPILILLFGIHPAAAVGTDLLCASMTKTGGTLAHALSRTVDWRITGRLAAGSVPAAATTLFVISHGHNAVDAGSQLITTVLGFAPILTAIALLFRQHLLDYFVARVGELEERPAEILTILLGSALGVFVTLTGVGAGAIGVTALLVPRLPTVRIVGSDIAHSWLCETAFRSFALVGGILNEGCLQPRSYGRHPGQAERDLRYLRKHDNNTR